METPRIEFGFQKMIAVGNPILQKGRLTVSTGKDNTAYLATSGLAGYQSIASTAISGRGRIPTCHQLGIDCYQVYTDPIFLPKVRGVEGNFYRITPFMVKVNGRDRGDFGIHYDTNVPGSAGCIVITDKGHWQKFQLKMQELFKDGITRLNLYVS